MTCPVYCIFAAFFASLKFCQRRYLDPDYFAFLRSKNVLVYFVLSSSHESVCLVYISKIFQSNITNVLKNSKLKPNSRKTKLKLNVPGTSASLGEFS